MKNLFISLLSLLSLISSDVQAAAQYDEVLRVSCLPEMKVFRAETLDVWNERLNEKPALLKDNGLYYWERLSLEKRAFETPLDYEISCVIDGINYQMSFYDLVLNKNSDDYTKGVILKADGKYIGDLSPLGTTRDYSYDKLEISGNNILISGDGYSEQRCYHNYRVPFPGENKSYTFNTLPRSEEILPEYNVAELICYPDLGIAGTRLHTNEETVKSADNYKLIKDNPEFKCGDIRITFQNNRLVKVYKKDALIKEVALNDKNRQTYSITYQEDANEVHTKSFDIDDIKQKCQSSYLEEQKP